MKIKSIVVFFVALGTSGGAGGVDHKAPKVVAVAEGNHKAENKRNLESGSRRQNDHLTITAIRN